MKLLYKVGVNELTLPNLNCSQITHISASSKMTLFINRLNVKSRRGRIILNKSVTSIFISIVSFNVYIKKQNN